MKTAIVYRSTHHGNTKKVLDAIRDASSDEIVLIDAAEASSVDLNGYDLIGLASGIYYSKFDKKVLAFARTGMPRGKPVFFLYTCGAERDGYTKAIRQALEGTDANVLGEFGCLGFNTYGPFKLIGGLAKDHPNEADLEDAAAFYRGLHEKLEGSGG